MVAAHEKYRKQGVIFLGMDVPWDREQAARRFVEHYRVPYPAGHDASGSVSRLYGVDATPTTYFIDREGRIADRVVGAMEPAVLGQHIRALLH